MPCSGRGSRAGTWNRLLPGEIVNLSGSQSVFAAEEPMKRCIGRCAEGDIGANRPALRFGGMLPRGEAGSVEAIGARDA